MLLLKMVQVSSSKYSRITPLKILGNVKIPQWKSGKSSNIRLHDFGFQPLIFQDYNSSHWIILVLVKVLRDYIHNSLEGKD